MRSNIIGEDNSSPYFDKNGNIITFYPLKQKDKNFIGKKFNHLTIIGKGLDYISPSERHQSQWWCQCDCGCNYLILVRRCNLISNNTTSCGCQKSQWAMQNIKKATEACKLNLTNKTFGELLVLEPTSERKNNSVIWKCQCSCGKIHYAPANELNAYRILSCGHLQESYGATKIQKLLIDNDIPFVKEKTFPTCRFSDSNAYARFDFWVNDEFLIEFDGIQHFREQDNKFFRDSLEKRQEHDNFKNNWCHKNGIPLKRIPYTDQNILTFDMIMGDKYLV